MATRNITKQLAGMQDLLTGKGSVSQSRGGSIVTINRIDTAFAVDSIAEMQAVDPNNYTRVNVYNTETNFDLYIYDLNATVGVSSGVGAGKWVKVNPSKLALSGNAVFATFADIGTATTKDGVLDNTTIAAMHAAGTLVRTEVNNTTSNDGGGEYELLTTTERTAAGIYDSYNSKELNGSGYWACLKYKNKAEVLKTGAIVNNSSDDSPSITSSLLLCNKAYLEEGISVTSAPVVLLEGQKITGEGSATEVGGVMDYGCWLNYSGSGNAITIDGEWTGFDSRRAIKLGGFSVKADTAAAGVYGDFLTESELFDLKVFGNGVAGSTGLELINSYNLSIRDSAFIGFETGHSLTIKATPDDVFTGQIHYDNVDFWDSTANGCELSASYNVFAQTLFSKCHWKTNSGIGLVIDGANMHTVEIVAGHFEQNAGGDLHVTSSVLHGVKVRAHFNSTLTTNPKILLDGNRTRIDDGCEFINGGTSIKVVGDSNIIGRSYHRNCSNPIVIDAAATNTFIYRQEFNTTTGTAISDSGSHTRYEGERTVSIEVDISNNLASLASALAELDEQYWVHSVKFTNATTLSAVPTFNVGRSSSLSYLVNSLTLSSATQFATQTIPRASLSNFFLDSGNIITAYNQTGSLTGRVLVEIRMIPWKFF